MNIEEKKKNLTEHTTTFGLSSNSANVTHLACLREAWLIRVAFYIWRDKPKFWPDWLAPLFMPSFSRPTVFWPARSCSSVKSRRLASDIFGPNVGPLKFFFCAWNQSFTLSSPLKLFSVDLRIDPERECTASLEEYFAFRTDPRSGTVPNPAVHSYEPRSLRITLHSVRQRERVRTETYETQQRSHGVWSHHPMWRSSPPILAAVCSST